MIMNQNDNGKTETADGKDNSKWKCLRCGWQPNLTKEHTPPMAAMPIQSKLW